MTHQDEARPGAGGRQVIALERYVPAYLTFVANKWSRSSSKLYLERFGIGVESWRIMVLLAIEGPITANRVCQVIHMDKASVSRGFKSMAAEGLITLTDHHSDARSRLAGLTAKGQALHDRIMTVALAREERLLSCLSAEERNVLMSLLLRVHANLPVLDEEGPADAP